MMSIILFMNNKYKMQKRSLRSVFFPKIDSPVPQQQLNLKKEQIVRSLESQYIRKSFFYRSQNNKTTQSKKYRDMKKTEAGQRQVHLQKYEASQQLSRYYNFQQKLHKLPPPSDSVPLTNKKKISIAKKSKRNIKNQILNTEPQEMRSHFCFSLIDPHPQKFYREKRKLSKIKTECQLQQQYVSEKTSNLPFKISDLLKVKRAAQFEYSIPDREQKKERQNRILDCLNSLKKMSISREKPMQITSIKGWNAQLGSTSEFFV